MLLSAGGNGHSTDLGQYFHMGYEPSTSPRNMYSMALFANQQKVFTRLEVRDVLVALSQIQQVAFIAKKLSLDSVTTKRPFSNCFWRILLLSREICTLPDNHYDYGNTIHEHSL